MALVPPPSFLCVGDVGDVGATLMLVVAETASVTQVFEMKRWLYSLRDPGINVADPQAVPFLGHTL